MKKQELYKILHKEKILYENLNLDEFLDKMDDISEEYYATGFIDPDDLIIECTFIEE